MIWTPCSTELISGSPASGSVMAATSLHMGCLSLSATADDSWREALSIDSTIRHAVETIQADSSAAAACDGISDVTAVGGTVTMAAGICLDLAAHTTAIVCMAPCSVPVPCGS